MRNLWISATSQAEGNLTLADPDNWGSQYSHIYGINVKTSSIDWSMWLCSDNSFSKSALDTHQIANHRNGNYDIAVDRPYNSDGENVYIIFEDHAGSDTADLMITGEKRGH